MKSSPLKLICALSAGAIAAAALVACGGSGTDADSALGAASTPTTPPPATALDELVGTWLSACRANGASSVSYQLTIAVDSSGTVNFTAVQNEFSDPACTTSSATPTLTGTLDPASLITTKTWMNEPAKRVDARVTGMATNGWSGSLSHATPYAFEAYYALSGNQLTLGKTFRLLTSTPLTRQ